MGRPIQKKYFANTNYQLDGEGVGGESVSTITISNSGTNYSQGTTLAFAAPQIAGGEQATVSYSINSAGSIAASVNAGGSGYTSAPALTVTTATGVSTAGTATNSEYTLTNVVSTTGIYVGMQVDAPWAMQANTKVAGVSGNSVTLDKTLTASTSSVTFTFTDIGSGFAKTVGLTTADRTNGIAAYAYIPASGSAGYISGTGGSSRVLGDIIRQSGNNKYVVQTAQGVGVCRLTADGSAANAEGEMDITATDHNGSTYRVMKLHARKAKLKQVSESTAFLVEDETWTKWTFSAATGTTVTIANN